MTFNRNFSFSGHVSSRLCEAVATPKKGLHFPEQVAGSETAAVIAMGMAVAVEVIVSITEVTNEILLRKEQA